MFTWISIGLKNFIVNNTSSQSTQFSEPNSIAAIVSKNYVDDEIN